MAMKHLTKLCQWAGANEKAQWRVEMLLFVEFIAQVNKRLAKISYNG